MTLSLWCVSYDERGAVLNGSQRNWNEECYHSCVWRKNYA